MLPGEGVVPVRGIMRKIWDIGFDGVVTDEMSSQRYSSWSRLRIAETLKARQGLSGLAEKASRQPD